ncbi:hypothetical protein, unlikely [Trypanosoma brucei gambiense DAL972]|uniref:Uncharacterized protein n=1 Tax=Trypanosoma brucei gambiense (strain MHOM/CI/86/DAL972) TaxID=679716 RepID=C9ZZB3_TRYB9|nr:hypothetical protein, unlikely [Trypanosoma brucei gambiense DAL972]CBH14762.1 hypothetical protein, unlikely [Trypanosoma brucei gambiense DAL972]|eukprot:XP_011777028.1 hypothetical protein, unlikely [Trypanosoma brucei gambiense DAL972]
MPNRLFFFIFCSFFLKKGRKRKYCNSFSIKGLYYSPRMAVKVIFVKLRRSILCAAASLLVFPDFRCATNGEYVINIYIISLNMWIAHFCDILTLLLLPSRFLMRT